jgi:hypothetical protein
MENETIGKEQEVDNKLAAAFEKLAKEIANNKTQEVDSKTLREEIDWNAMSPEEFAENVRIQAKREVFADLNPLINQVVSLTYERDKKNASQSHPDIGQYEKEIQKVLTAHPSLEVSDALLLVKAKQPPSKEKEIELKSIFNVDNAKSSKPVSNTAIDAGLKALKDLGITDI